MTLAQHIAGLSVKRLAQLRVWCVAHPKASDAAVVVWIQAATATDCPGRLELDRVRPAERPRPVTS